jgi:hypothetical protein
MHSTNGDMRLDVQNNNFGDPAQTFTPGIKVNSGSTPDASFSPTICTNISGNTSGHGPDDGSGNRDPGIDLYKRSPVTNTYIFGIVGLSPNPATPPQVETYLGGLNPNSATASASEFGHKALVVSPSDRTAAAFTPCTLPSPLRPAP